MSTLYSVVYVSTAVRPFSQDDLAALLTKSRERNRAAGITGMLLYKDGCFIQAFEGEHDAATKLRERIRQDRRHQNIVMIFEGWIASRDFSDWSMGFKHLDYADVESYPDLGEMLDTLMRHGRFSMEPELAFKLLHSFTEQVAQ